MNLNQKKISGMNITVLNMGYTDISGLCNSLAKCGMIVDCTNDMSSEIADKCLTYNKCIIVAADRYEDMYKIRKFDNSKYASLPVIGICDCSPLRFLDKIANSSFPDHIFISKMPEFESWIIANIAKLTCGKYEGISYYLSHKNEIKSLKITDSKMKEHYIKVVLEHFVNNNLRHRTLHDIESILDEMITNAIYNAPVDKDGNKLYQHRDRKECVVLSDKQAGTLSYAVDDRKIYLSVKDPFGSLTKERLLTYLGKCFKEDHVYVENKAGGAGIGLHKILRMSHNFVVNIDPGKYTEIISCISLNASQQNQETASMDLFVKGKKNG